MRRVLLPRKALLRCLGALLVSLFLVRLYGAAIDHAKITEVVNDVAVFDPQSRNSNPAKAAELFRSPEIMKTGAASRSEMVAEDQTITRVGANTLFSFEPKERVINLREGSVLFQSPAGKGGGTIRTAAATASVLGTTIIVAATKDGGFKLLVLEGRGEVRMPNGKHRMLHGGQMIFVPAGAKDPGPVLDFRLKAEVDTGLLVRGFNNPLPSWDKIQKTIFDQEEEIATGRFRVAGLVLGYNPDPNTRINQIQGLHLPRPEPTPVTIQTPPRAPTPPIPRGSPFR